MIELTNVSKNYKDKVIFKDVNLKIDRYGVYIIRGKNGVGKTTLLNIIAKLTSYDGEVNNKFINSMGYLWQNYTLVDTLTIREHLKMFEVDESSLSKYDLLDKVDSYPMELSSGERQRIAFILSLYSNNDLVILDEPISNVNDKYVKKMNRDIIKNKKDKIILIVTHNLQKFIDCCDGEILISNENVFLKMKNYNKKIDKDKKKKSLRKKSLISKNNKGNIVLLLLAFMIFLLSLGEIIIFKLLEFDKSNSLEINKYYLKDCKEVENNNFKITSCYNPSYDKLKGIEYKYNYDYLLSFLYSRDDLKIISNKNIHLKEGRYPRKEHEVITSDRYKIGETITIESNSVVHAEEVDFYKEKISLTVVGIYRNSFFQNKEYIYFDYDLLYNYFNDQMLINNKININQYYELLPLDNNKFISFIKKENVGIYYQSIDEEYYSSIEDIVYKISELLVKLRKLVLIVLIYCFVRENFNYLKSKKKYFGYLISNGFSKYFITKNDIKNKIFILSVLIAFGIILFIFGRNIYYIREIIFFCIIMIIIFIYQIKFIYSRKSIDMVMRNNYA